MNGPVTTRWPLERVLFVLAGTVTLLSAVLAPGGSSRTSPSATNDSAEHDHPGKAAKESDQMSTTITPTQHTPPLERAASRGDPMRVPLQLPGVPERMIIDTTWGTIQPIRLHPEIETVGELEVIDHLKAGLPLIDTRRRETFAAGTIPGARSLPHTEVAQRHRELDPATPAILFCNGPQCAATPNAIRTLLAHGHPATMLRYYRGGIHDWLTLGLPSTPGRGRQEPGLTGEHHRVV